MLWQYNRPFLRNQPNSRTSVKADAMIIAAGKAQGVRYFFSDDTKARQMAERAGLQARCLPETGFNLFSKLRIADEDEEERSRSHA